MRKETLYDFAGREAEQVCLRCVRGGRDPILYTAHTSDLDSIFYTCAIIGNASTSVQAPTPVQPTIMIAA